MRDLFVIMIVDLKKSVATQRISEKVQREFATHLHTEKQRTIATREEKCPRRES